MFEIIQIRINWIKKSNIMFRIYYKKLNISFLKKWVKLFYLVILFSYHYNVADYFVINQTTKGSWNRSKMEEDKCNKLLLPLFKILMRKRYIFFLLERKRDKTSLPLLNFRLKYNFLFSYFIKSIILVTLFQNRCI